jgi:hypothetical protein
MVRYRMSLIVFVLMPFKPQFTKRYEQAIKRAVEDSGMRAERVDKQSYHHQGITDRVLQQIEDSDILIADMSGNNSNVLYEVGYAHAKNKLCILLTNRTNKIPFDLKNKRHVVFSGLNDLRKKISKELKALTAEMELSFVRTDPECMSKVPVSVIETKIVGQSEATSIRARIRSGSELRRKNISAEMLKIDRRIGNARWKRFKLEQPIQLTWTDTNAILTNFPPSATKYVNVFHIDHRENKLTLWGVSMPQTLSDFLSAQAKYRVTLSVMGRQLQLEMGWHGQWDTISVQAVSP